MESLLNRYRSITVLLLVIFAQLVLLAVQVKNDQNVSVIRSWTVTAVSPAARILEWGRHSSVGFVRNYVLLRDAGEENRNLQSEVGRLKVENVFLKNELNLADRAKALQSFAARVPSKTLAATVFMSAAGSDSNAVFVDRGSLSGVERGMGVVTPDGIVGKVLRVNAMSSMVGLISDQDFAAGVTTQGGQVRGILKGQGKPMCKVDYVPFEDKIAPGDLLFTSGDDHIFPRGFPVGVVKSVSNNNGQSFKDILAEPSGLRHGVPEDVLIIIEGVHQEIPEAPPANQPVYINPSPPATAQPEENAPPGPVGTEADRAKAQAKAIGDAQGHVFGSADGKVPDFNVKTPLPPASPAGQPGAAPSAPQSKPAPGNGAPPASKAGDSTRRANQAAGAPPGGKQN
jgi:rod shape-determining protein MreC